MQNEILQKIIDSLEAIKLLASLIGTLFVFSGGLIGYIFLSYKKQNGTEHTKLFTKTEENAECIKYIKGRLKL